MTTGQPIFSNIKNIVNCAVYRLTIAGTGKIRTVLGMIYRFLKTNRFKRILFLVDRTSLGEQTQDVFKEVKLEELMTLDEIYNIKWLDEKTIDKETRIQISTAQGIILIVLRIVVFAKEVMILMLSQYFFSHQ